MRLPKERLKSQADFTLYLRDLPWQEKRDDIVRWRTPDNEVEKLVNVLWIMMASPNEYRVRRDDLDLGCQPRFYRGRQSTNQMSSCLI